MSQSRTRCSAERDVRLVTSNVHPGRPCQPCVLCNRGNLSKYFHPKSWKDGSLLETLQQHEPSLHIEADSCICRQSLNEVKDIKRDQFMPRWRKSRMTQICIVPECTHSAQKATKLTSKSAILRFFTTENTEDSDMSQSSDSTNEGVPLCAEHYGAWYRSSHPSQPSLIHNFLRENTDFSGEIGPNDRACYTCYKSHLITIKHINHTAQSIKQDLGTLLT